MNTNNQVPSMYETNPVIAGLNKVPGFNPLRCLRQVKSGSGGADVLKLDLRYKKLWFRLAYPAGRLKVINHRITEQLAIIEAKVYLDKNDSEPIANFTVQRTAENTPGGLYIQVAQHEAMDAALNDAGFGLQFSDVSVAPGEETYGSEIPLTAVDVSAIPALSAETAPGQQSATGQASTSEQIPVSEQLPASGQTSSSEQIPTSGQPTASEQITASGQPTASEQIPASGQQTAPEQIPTSGQTSASGQLPTSDQQAASGQPIASTQPHASSGQLPITTQIDTRKESANETMTTANAVAGTASTTNTATVTTSPAATNGTGNHATAETSILKTELPHQAESLPVTGSDNEDPTPANTGDIPAATADPTTLQLPESPDPPTTSTAQANTAPFVLTPDTVPQAEATQSSQQSEIIPIDSFRYSKATPVADLLTTMTYEEACDVYVDTGVCKGMSMKTVAERRPPSLRWFINGYTGDNNILRAAAQIMLDPAAARKAG